MKIDEVREMVLVLWATSGFGSMVVELQ